MTSTSPLEHEPVRRCLLALLGADPQSAVPLCAGLGVAEWDQVGHIVEQHRLGPLLYQATAHWQQASPIPESLRASWAANYRETARTSLALQAALVRINGILSDAGIAYAALKGARLAWHSYAHPGMRPMRDLDVLVSPGHVLEAYQALLARGFEPWAGATTPLEAALRDHKHLPPLTETASGVHVEVHSRLLEYPNAAQALATLGNADDLLAERERLPLGQASIAYLPPAETLLHVIVHAAVEHRFDNGPQALHDVATLLASTAIDWTRFWSLSREGGWERGCVMLLRLTEHLLGEQPIAWEAGLKPDLPAHILDQALLLMLQNTDLRHDLAVQRRLGGSASTVGYLLSRIVPARHHIAAYARIAPDSRLVWLHYPAWLFSRISRTFRGATNPRQRAEAARAMAVEQWLAGD
jgi:Uncharacterised nucleotidyltransferase